MDRAPARPLGERRHLAQVGSPGLVEQVKLEWIGSYHFLGVGVGNGMAVGISPHHPGVNVGWLASGVSCCGCQGAGVAVASFRRAWWAAVKISATISSRKNRNTKGALRFMR